MMNDKLPAEWEALVREIEQGIMYPRTIVERCYALANKPPKELTDSMLATIGRKSGMANLPLLQLRSIIVEYERVMREPETVTFRAARRIPDGGVNLFQTPEQLLPNDDWEWLDIDGKPQEFTVRLA